MAIHGEWSRFLPTLNGNVMESGGSLNLAKGQLGIFDVKKRTKDGLPALSNFDGLSKQTQLQIRVGNHEKQLTRTQGNKSKSTRTFKIGEIESLEVSAPERDKKVDDIIVGYDGINPETALTFEKGDNDVLNIGLSGKAIFDLSYNKGVFVNTFFKKERDDQTNQEIVEKAVEMLKNDELVSSVPLTDFLDITVINSENPATLGTPAPHTYYNLNIVDSGNSNALANIQSQYNYKIKRTDRVGLTSVYTVLLPDGVTPDDYVKTVSSVLKGCDTCPTGFTAEDGGYIYYVTLEDDGSDSKATVEAITGAIAGTAVKQGQDNGVGVYAVAVTDKLTQEQIDTFVTTNPTSVVELVGKTEDICNNTTETTVAWVEGDTCNAITEEYILQLPDDKCGDNVLDDLQDSYPDLTIVVKQDGESNPVQGGCQTVFSTNVTTNVVCEDCDPIFRKVFESEAPEDYGVHSWKKAPKQYSDTALMGIRIKGKETIVEPGEYVRDEVPFINSSVHIEVSGGHYTGVSSSFVEGGDRFPVKILSRATDLTNLGGTLWELEDRDNTYFEGYERHKCNNYAKSILGEESVLKPTAQYVVYKLKVAPKTRSQGFAGVLEEGFIYMIAAEVGKHKKVEDLLNGLAARAGVPTVKAYGSL